MHPSAPKRYHAFVSYNSLDRPAVQELAGRLKGAGLELYLEEWELAPGREFQPALAEGLRDSQTCVVFLGPNGLGPWQKQEIQVAIDKRARDSAFPVIPVLLPGAERPRRGNVAHLEFLINASWVEFLKTLDDAAAFDNLLWGIKGKKQADPAAAGRYEGVCPYRGLEAFRPEDAPFFFGREALTGWLASALRREVRAAQGVRFLGVLGPSGSGKSSVVLAGLVPRLKEGAIEGSEGWPITVVRPGDESLKNLAAGVVPPFLPAGSLPDVEQARKLIESLRGDPEGQALDLFVRMGMGGRPADQRLVVVVDQFEEVFTYRPQDEQGRERFERGRSAFFVNLLNAAAAPGGRVAVVLTMRSDFLGACAAFRRLADVLCGHQELVGPMTREELREAVERPAYLVGHEVEPALVERLLADVEGQPGALPLLQFALTEVWKKRDVRRLTLRAYEELGGIAGALEHRANEVYRGLSAEAQEHCRRVFLRLVQPGEGTEDTKRRVPYRELLPEDPARAVAVRQLIEALADRDTRLLTTEGDAGAGGVVEVAHEALVRGWTQLRQWLHDEREGLRIQRRLTEAAREWADAAPEQKDDYLYAGARLAVCREWAGPRRGDLNPVELTFLAASEEAERQREQKELEAERKRAQDAEARKREAEAAAEREKRLRRRWRIAAAIGLALAVTAGGMAWWAEAARIDADKARGDADKKAMEAREQAERADKEAARAKGQAALADARRIAALSDSERDKRLDRALLLAVEAVKYRRAEDTYEARNSLLKALLARPGLTSFLHADEDSVRGVALSPDGRTLAAGYYVGGGGGGVVLWDVGRRARLADQPLAVAEGGVYGVAFSPDGRTLAAGLDGIGVRGVRGGVVLWDVGRRARLAGEPLAVAEGYVSGVAFSPDGKTLAAGYDAGGVRGGVVLWDVDLSSWLRLAGRTANRNFTRAEWRQYFPDTPYRPTFDDLPVPPEPGRNAGTAPAPAARDGRK